MANNYRGIVTPAEKKASELAEQHINDPSRTGQKYDENDLKRISDFKAGFLAALELEEVKGLASRLENAVYHQEKARNFISHFDDCNALIDEIPEDESCQCGMDMFAHNNHLSISITKEALTAWRSFRGEK